MPRVALESSVPLTDSELASAFHRELIDEHLEVLDFLIDKRRQDLDDVERPWTALQAPEQRCRRHVLALRAFGDAATEVCHALLAGDDDGLRLAASFVLTYLADTSADMEAVLASLDEVDPSAREAYVQALRWEPPRNARELFQPALAAGTPAQQGVALLVLADCSALDERTACELAASEHEALRAAAQRALAVAPTRDGLARLRQAMDEHPLPAETAAALLCDAGTRAEAGRRLAWDGASAPPPWLPYLAMLAPEQPGHVSSDTLASGLQAHGPDPNLLQAIGVRGEGRLVPPLLQALQAHAPAPPDEDTDEGAAPQNAPADAIRRVLRRITGGFDLGAAFASPELCQTAIRDASSEAFTASLRADAKAWDAFWLEAGQAALSPATRYRYGRPVDAQATARELAHPATCARHRKLAAIEHARHLGRAWPFEPDWAVQRQRERISALEGAEPAGAPAPSAQMQSARG